LLVKTDSTKVSLNAKWWVSEIGRTVVILGKRCGRSNFKLANASDEEEEYRKG
jgi:hypothetical protein